MSLAPFLLRVSELPAGAQVRVSLGFKIDVGAPCIASETWEKVVGQVTHSRLMKDSRAPFIHSLIVDEWETANPSGCGTAFADILNPKRSTLV